MTAYLPDNMSDIFSSSQKMLDSPPEEAFDRFTRLATKILNAPVVPVSLIAS